MEDITDYKFHCFNGNPKYVEVVFERFSNRRRNIYDINWKLANFQLGLDKNTEEEIQKPKNFEKMKEIANVLAKEFSYCRVDLYNDREVIKFGEITFTPASGLDELSEEVDLLLGNLWKD